MSPLGRLLEATFATNKAPVGNDKRLQPPLGTWDFLEAEIRNPMCRASHFKSIPWIDPGLTRGQGGSASHRSMLAESLCMIPK